MIEGGFTTTCSLWARYDSGVKAEGDGVRFSEVFELELDEQDDWFDPFLEADTRLFVDPFLVYADDEEHWAAAHGRLIDFFNMVLELVALSGFRRHSAHWRAAERLMVFPEPAEFCLGFAESSTAGAGSGRGLQAGMLEGAKSSVQLGILAVEHFEELTLFESGIGADRIGDITCNVLKHEFVEYTQGVAARHDVPTESIRLRHATWNRDARAWLDRFVNLPRNPYSGRAILLAPRRFLRELPSVDPVDFWNWCWSNANEEIRGAFNYDIGRHVDGRTIARFARLNPHLAGKYLRHLEEQPKPPYDFERDPQWQVEWYAAGARFADQIPLARLATTPAEFCDFVEAIVSAFAQNVEEQDGWILLWNDEERPRAERIVQALFRSTVIHYCRANDIDLSGESNAGRGPVDFKFSQGWEARAVVEVKLTNNSRYWHGLTRQTPQYMRSEEVECGFFVSVGFRDDDFEEERESQVQEAARSTASETGRDVRVVFVDARRKKSASKL